ncbi:interleukin-1 receptor type 1-like [Astyanax mexicanus]|uniref:Interleukin-1 receptor type 1-like n=1 Tax=Astyanax mexicanus TaxID=7994 RepID=A0A8T2LKC2_ASTMX|nr:interleukin-1 receptor type 1-like [Astyanax mexicanus]
MIHSVSLQCLILTLSSFITGYQHKLQEIPAGHVFPLECTLDDMKIRWGSEKQQELDMESLPAGMKIINQALWFLPAQPSHSGNYYCSSWSNHSKEHNAMANFSVAVTNRTSSPKTIHLSRDRNGFLNCKSNYMTKIFQLDPHSHVSWIKNGTLLEGDSLLLIQNVAESDEGEYTCSVNFTHEGNVYTAAQTFRVRTHYATIPQKPRVVKPQKEIHSVTVGSRHDLNCKALVGTDQEDPVDPFQIYWLVNGKYAERVSKHFIFNVSRTVEHSTIYYQNNLTILDIQKEFLHIPFMCVILNSKGSENGTAILIPATESYWVMLPVAGCLVVALVLLVFHFFKVDLVLAYRKLSPCLKRQCDGKLYDGYVSYSHGNYKSMSFALKILPEILEDHLGYKLFISGRDELPGGAVHDVIADAVKKCRRLIIVLGSRSSTEHLSLNNNERECYPPLSDPTQTTNLNLDPYEWSVGLYDALVKGGLKIILVQVGGEVDEAQLPESLRYIRRTQGILRWKQDYITKPSGRFWKQLRYRMPLVQKVKLNAVV